MSSTATESASAPLLAVFDLDGTITRHDSMLPFVCGFLLRHPWRAVRLPLAVPAVLRFLLFKADRGALKGALLHTVMGGASHAAVEQWAARYVQRLLQYGLFGEALAAITAHRQAGHHLVLMSASVDCYVPRIAEALGFRECICSQVRWHADQSLDGRLTSANMRGAEKSRRFSELLVRLQPAESVAYGNSTADLAHMQLATRGIFVNGRLADVPADASGIAVVRWRNWGHPAP